MKKFEFFRYLKKFSALILAVAIAGSGLIYLYAVKNQKYTAEVIIQFTNEEMKEGLAPDGTAFDVNEIYSSVVVAHAMDSLGIEEERSLIRSSCNIEEVIPEEQKMLTESLIDLGKESEYHPDTFKVRITVDGNKGREYARNVLDAIIKSYCGIYTEKYVEQRLILNPSRKLLDNGYEYYESVYILEDDTNKMLYYLEDKKKNYPEFRASASGYTYVDLYEIYSYLKDCKIPELYAAVLDGPQVRNGEVLVKALNNHINSALQQEKIDMEHRNYLKYLIDNYSQQNKDMMNYHYHNKEKNNSTDYILKDVYDRNNSNKTRDNEITYDTLIQQYVDIDKKIRVSVIDRQYQQKMLELFTNIGPEGSGTSESHAAMEQAINDYEKSLAYYYDIVCRTGSELNQALSADYLKMVNSIQVYDAINVRLYVVIALMFFLIVGCVFAILLGRIGDLIDYFLYVDKKTGLPNREGCNSYISKMAKDLLPDDFTCMHIDFSGLTIITNKYGYKVGDSVLKDFAGLVESLGMNDSFIGYNGIGKFVLFFNHCNHERAKAIVKVLKQYTDEYNSLNPDYKMEYQVGYSTTTEDGIYEIHNLLRNANSKTSKETVASQEA